MEVDATITKRTVSRVMPVLAKSEVIVEPARVSDGRIDSGWTLPFPEQLFSVIDFVFSEGVVGVAILTPVHCCVNLALLDFLGDVYVLQVLALG